MNNFDFQPTEPEPEKRTNGYGALFDLHKCMLWKMEEGTHNIRLLPPNPGKSPGWGIPVAFHYGVPLPSTGEKRTWLCLREMRGHRNCPACDVFFALHREDPKHPQKPIFRAGKSFITRVLVRGEHEETPVMWRMPKTINDLLRTKMEKKKCQRFDHPFEGMDLEVVRSGKGLNTTYSVIDYGDPGPIHADEKKANQVLDHIRNTPLGSLLLFLDKEEEKALKAAFEETPDGSSDEEQESFGPDF